ncbi:MAG: hypothetical protein JSS51_08965 [Planctomycetes bacterium]|nr:hypothetical protein [Planctomycetota bacterium]
MFSRGIFVAGIAAFSLCTLGSAQMPKQALGMKRVAATPSSSAGAARAEQPRVLWIRNEMTGQVVYPDQAAVRAEELPDPVVIYDNFSNPDGVAGINLNWNYAEAYGNKDFKAPSGGSPLRFGVIDISSDPTDPDAVLGTVDGEKVCLMYEPYTATNWPSSNLNDRHSIRGYTTTVSSYSQQFEIRVCRITFFSREVVYLPFDQDSNPYKVELQLSFAYVSFPFRTLESVVGFDLSSFDPPLTIKGEGLIFTHWLRLSQPPPCVGDLDLDGLVEDADFSLFVVQYNTLDCADPAMPEFCSADFNGDGFVDDEDFQTFAVAYNNLLCPPGFVIRKAYAMTAGGRFRWNNETNGPDFGAEAIPTPSGGWPFPNSLVTVPNIPGSIPPPGVGCSLFGCQPSFSIYFTTLTGFHTVSELNMSESAPLLATEYERFLNEVIVQGQLRPYAVFDVESYLAGGFQNTDWVPSSTPKLLSITPPAPPQKP